MNIVKSDRGKVVAFVAIAVAGVAWSAGLQRYTPVPGGYETCNGDGEFNRPLYGWHGDDRELKPCKSLPWTGDRPKVALKVFRGYRIDKKVRGVLQFGDGTEDVDYRYVWGRAEYDLKGKGTVKMVRSAQSDGLLVETTGNLPPKFDGEWMLAAKGERGGATYYDFERKGGPFKGWDARCPSVAEMFDAATNHFERIARTIEIKTPDPILDSLLPCQLLVADAMFEGRHITHGATNWKQAFAGWRVAYICYATGWEERFKENAREHFRSQRADGRIPNEPKRDSQYNMCEEFVVSVMRYWRWTHDDDFMREIAYDGVKRHLEWMDCNMKVPGTELYENWLNTWNTDDKWTNGGAGTISSAYYAYDCRVMAEVAQRLGKMEDAAYFAVRSKAVEDAIAKSLWHEGDGVWGEYRERFGLKRLMRAPDLSTVYIAIDNLVPDLARNRRAVFWVEDNVPTFFTKDGAALLYSSNRLPLFWTSCGRYPNETIFWALACYQAGEPELGWRNLHDAAAISARGVGCGPGVGTCDLNFDFACYSNIDFADNTAGYLRAVTEGVFGIVEGREIRPSFPASWNEAEIKSPYISYRWTRTGGVKVTGGSRAATVKVIPAPKPQFAGAAIPPRHTRWGHPKGEGFDLSIPQGAKAEFVDLSKSFNQNLRLLHKGKYSPRIANKPWSRIPRTLMANGRAWWEHHETAGNRHWPKDYAVPKTLEHWPVDGALVTEYGPTFRLGPKEGKNAAFTSFYEQFPDAVEIPLSGKARKIVLLTAIVTNPNVAWMEAARMSVQYADGSEASLSLVPPDNCDDWLNYSQGQWSYYDAKRDNRPYAVKGRPVMLGATAHASVHAISLDPAKELKSLRIECRGTETFVGLLAATLYRIGKVASQTEASYGRLLRTACADPWLFRHEGKFYLTQTGSSKVLVEEAKTLSGLSSPKCTKHLAYDAKGDPMLATLGYTGANGVWSPEIHHFSDDDFPGHAGWYMFTALRDSAPGDSRHVKSIVLKSLSGKPEGPYGNPVTGEKYASHLVLDKDGAPYPGWLVGQTVLRIREGEWKGVYSLFVSETGRGTADFHQEIRIARLKTPWQMASDTGIVTVPTQPWESIGSGPITDPVKRLKTPYYPRVVEGATAVYGDRGEVYLIYSGSGFWTNYGLGQLTWTGGDPLRTSSWVKYAGNPVFGVADGKGRHLRGVDKQGAGHASFFVDEAGMRHMVYHAYPYNASGSGKKVDGITLAPRQKAKFRNAYVAPYIIDYTKSNGVSTGVFRVP